MTNRIITFIFALCAALAVLAQKTYTPNLVTPPKDMKTVSMMANITTVDFYGNTGTEMLNLNVGSVAGEVYIQGFVSDEPDAWIKGTVNAEKDVITFPHGQYLGLFFGILDLYACAYKGEDTSKRCDFVLERNTKSGVMKNRSDVHFCTYYYDDYSTSANKYSPEQRYNSVTITPMEPWEPEGGNGTPDVKVDEPVKVPDGVVFSDYTLTANNIRTGRITHPARLGFDGEDVYLGGFSNVAILTDSYIKGYREGNRIVFPYEQYIVKYENHDMYLYGASYYLGDKDLYLDNLSFIYDALTNTYRGEVGLLVADGKAVDGNIMNFSEFLQDIILTGDLPDGVAPSATVDATAPAAVYTLDGRRCPAAAATSLPAHRHGVSIVRQADGTIRKQVR